MNLKETERLRKGSLAADIWLSFAGGGVQSGGRGWASHHTAHRYSVPGFPEQGLNPGYDSERPES